MTNYIEEGKTLTVVCDSPATPASGGPVRVGNLTGVACLNEGEGGAGATETVAYFGYGVFDLSVAAVNDLGNSAVVIGDPIYYVDGDTPHLSKKTSGYFFGYALEAINAGVTATINVLKVHSSNNGTVDIQSADVTIATAAVKTLNATPVQLVAAPGATKALIFCGAELMLDYASAAYDGIAAGEDLSIKIENAGGAEMAQIEATGFLDQASDQIRYVYPKSTAAITPVANKALVLHMLVGEIATGDSPLKVRTYYRTVPIQL